MSASYRMSCVKSKNTGPEMAMRRLLRHARLKFRGHIRDLPGTPDFLLTDYDIVIEVDGEFWHGRDFARWRKSLAPGWERKISENVRRDRRNRRGLTQLGYEVVSLWGRDVLRNPSGCITEILAAVRRVKGG